MKPKLIIHQYYPLLLIFIVVAGPREALNPYLNIDQRIAYYVCVPGS